MRRNIKTKKIKISAVVLFLSVAVLSIAILTSVNIFSSFNINNNVYADSQELSPQDIGLLRAIRASIQNCFNNSNFVNQSILKKIPIRDSSTDIRAANKYNFFNVDYGIYQNDGTIILPYRYGTGNTIRDSNLSCNQLINSFEDGSENKFTTFTDLGGHFYPKDNDSVDIKNQFLEALGYTDAAGSDSMELYCTALTYTVTKNGIGEDKKTQDVCVRVSGGKIMPTDGKTVTSKDFYTKKTTQDDIIGLEISGRKLKVNINPPESTPGPEVQSGHSVCVANTISNTIAESKDINSFINTSANDFFRTFFEQLADDKLGSSKVKGEYQVATGNPLKFHPTPMGTYSCQPSVAEVFGATSVVAKTNSVVDNYNNGQDKKNQIVKGYEYTGSVDPLKLMKYFVPAYNELVMKPTQTKRVKGYNWFYLLKDVFEGISIDASTGCSTTKPQSGSYLPYYRDSKDDPNKKEIQYCILDQTVLFHKKDTAIMDKSTVKGAVYGLPEGDSYSPTLVTIAEAQRFLANTEGELPEICSLDPNFPLCQATPLECKDNPNQEGCKDLTGNNASEEEDGANGESATCFANAGALGWIICPLMYTLRDAVQGIFNEFVEPLIRVDESIVTNLAQNDDSSAMYKAWSMFRNMANIIFVIALLFVVFSQVTGFGIDNYGIKRLLPKIIVTAIIVNFSYIICGIVVDLSNLIGNSVRSIFENAASGLTATSGTGSDGLGAAGVTTGVAAAVTGVVALVAAGAALSTAAASGGLLALILPVLGLVASAFVAGFFALLMLGARQAIIIIMIVTSPIAFVLYALPNTNALFKKWVSLFRGLLLLYPVYCFMVGGGFMAARLIVMSSTGVFIQLVAGFISIAPYFAVPSMTRNALKGFDAAVNGIANLQNRANRGMQFAGKKIMNSDTVKASAGNYEFGKQAKFAKKYEGYSQEQFAKMKPGERRRIMNALGVVGKDAQQAATIGAAMSQYKFNTSNEGKARAGAMAMTAEDENQVKAHQSDLINQNMSYDEALQNLTKMQNDGYTGNKEEDHKRDLQMRAYQRHILSTKEGQKAYEKYLQTGAYTDSNGRSTPVNSSERSRAVLARDYISNNSDLKDKYGITYQQMQGMQGAGAIDDLKTSTTGPIDMKGSRNKATNKFIEKMDSKDIRSISKNDATELNDAMNGGMVAAKTKDEFKQVLRDAARVFENDPAQVGELNDATRNLITNHSGTDLNNLGNRVMEIRDNSGQVTQTISWGKNGPVNGNGSGNGGPTP